MLGDHLKTKMQLFGLPGNPDTLKCLMTAGEKGVDIDSRVIGEDALSADDIKANHIRSVTINV